MHAVFQKIEPKKEKHELTQIFFSFIPFHYNRSWFHSSSILGDTTIKIRKTQNNSESKK